MVQAVGMIGKNENSSVERGRWPSLPNCIQSLIPSCFSCFFSLLVLALLFCNPFFFVFSLILTRAEADARKQQQQLQQQQEESRAAAAASELKSASVVAEQDQRKTLKFGFSSKGGTSKVCACYRLNINNWNLDT